MAWASPTSSDPPVLDGAVRQFGDVTAPLEVEADAVVVGSGAGGSAVAAELSEAGLSVVVLEEGGLHDTRTFHADAIEMVKRLYRGGGSLATRTARPIVERAGGRGGLAGAPAA